MVELVPALGVDHLVVVAPAGGLTEAAGLLVLVAAASRVALGQVSSHNFSQTGKNNKCLQNCFH